jgi:bifunctional non-homologous end joining protein LigD
VPDKGTLAALVDCGCLSFHPWNSTADAPLQPTQMVFNLDPEAIAFREVRQAAQLLRALLADCGLTAWVKTSGGHGLHVLVPLKESSFDDARLVADTIAKRAMRREPKLFSRDPRRGRRRGRIFIDTCRNERGATIIAPYATATSGLVSVPLEWDDLQRPIYPDEFDMESAVARAATHLEREAAFMAAEHSLEQALSGMRRRRSRIESAPL